MILQSQTLTLRLIQLSDLEALYALQSNPLVAQYNTIGVPDDMSFTKNLIVNALSDVDSFGVTNFWWGVFLKKEDKFIGEAGLNLALTQYKSAEIFYAIDPHFWRQGYATEVVETILHFGFADLDLHRISTGVATENIASIKLLEKVGMKREGRHRKIMPIRGEWWDNYHYAILDEDFFGNVGE
ncbi:MAG: GNAT family protein [Bacteroidota bacterium]